MEVKGSNPVPGEIGGIQFSVKGTSAEQTPAVTQVSSGFSIVWDHDTKLLLCEVSTDSLSDILYDTSSVKVEKMSQLSED